MNWTTTTPTASAYYWAVPKDRDDWLDGTPEVVYLYYDGKRSVFRPGDEKRFPLDVFSHWCGPLDMPTLPPELEGA